ncbi:glycoside hydrolase family 26 protein [Flavobacterium sp. MK4S-17]|uniref:glycoside hydrolase family 26 protein n=1 Tax=Flavobacterium sp. MK4S-17 TaxID=2543737 RepID=UPI00135C9364|nr:glycosyl hydrolase [Flavobacterium sp. MK4S-17]
MKRSLSILIAVLIISCKGNNEGTNKVLPIDKQATEETKKLYANLFNIKDKGFMFGHQDDLAYGVEWKYEEGRSDIKDVTGDYPAVYGWDIGRIENNADKNLDGVPFDKMREYIKQVYDRGGVNTISWHINNPMTGGDSWDNTPGTVASILPGGEQHEKYKRWLDSAAAFLLSLKGSDGKPVPILYRPYHEFTGNWFWWCKNTTSKEDFINLWKFTVNYFQEKGVHNLIYVYNTSDANVNTKEDFLAYYPGDNMVDMVSFDIYQSGGGEKQDKFINDTKRLVGIIDEVAQERSKLSAIAECGYEQVPYEKWWTETLMNSIGNHEISYVLVWRNHGWNEWMKPPRMHYYAPYKGHQYEKDFIEFYKNNKTLFQQDVTKFNLYK